MRRTHPLIVGGGPSGAMAAICLERAGERPLLLERSTEARDGVCGGFLSGDTIAMLESTGIDIFSLGARRVTRLHLVAGRRDALIDLPFRAAGLSRRTLDTALLSLVGAVERGVTARAIDTRRLAVKTGDGAPVEASAVFLATGKHDLRGAARDADAGSDPPVGLRVRLAPTSSVQRALADRIELILLDRGYAGLVLHEDGSANLCLTVARSRLDRVAGDRNALLDDLSAEAPVLGERIAQSGGLGGWSSIARVPYGWRASLAEPSVFRLGDQAAVIASLAGDGIAIALRSAAMAADQYVKHGPDGATGFQRHLARIARRPLRIASMLRGLAESGSLAPIGIRALDAFPTAALVATRATRIGAY